MTSRNAGSLLLSLSLLGCAEPTPPEAKPAGAAIKTAAAVDPTLPVFLSVGEATVLGKLESILDIDVKDKPLRTFIMEVGKRIGVPMALDDEGLQNAMVEANAPITLRLHGASAASVLKLALDPLNLVASIREDVIVVTDKSSTKKSNIIRLYSIADLCVARKGGKYVERGNEIAKVIRESVHRDVWDDPGGGDATIHWIPGLLALSVSAPEDVHPEIALFLAGLRAVKGKSNALLKSTGMPAIDEVTAALEAAPPPDWAKQAANPAPAAFVGSNCASASPPDDAPAVSTAEAAARAADEARRIGERALRIALKLEVEWETKRAGSPEAKKEPAAPK